MKNYLGIAILALAISAPVSLAAEHHEEKEDRYIYATYFYCKTATQEQADELVKKNVVPVNATPSPTPPMSVRQSEAEPITLPVFTSTRSRS